MSWKRGQAGDKVRIEVWNHLPQSLVYKREFLLQRLMFLLPLGSVYLHKHNSGYSSIVPSSKTSETIRYFFKCMGNKQNHSIHGANVPLTYKLNLKKTSPFPRHAYKGKKKSFFMTEKSFTVDWLIKHFGPKV